MTTARWDTCGFARVVGLAVLVLASGCGSGGDGTDPGPVDRPDAAAGGDADVLADVPADALADVPGYVVPALVLECSACHDVNALTTASPGAGRAPGDWSGEAAEGLVRVDPLFPEPGTWWAVPWPRRGNHASTAGCSTCHPVAPDGTGHGLRVYPSPDKAFTGGQDCAAACHAWIEAAGGAQGFPGAADVPAQTGSLRPGALLALGPGGHAALWREGARPANPAAFRISAFRPGCAGCHNLMAEDHGATLNCLDCHDFQSSTSAIHTAHVGAIADGQARFDPEGAAARITACDYCHAGADTGPTGRSRRACHNCHLSGHAPMGPDGRPQFWPLGAE